MLCTQEKLMSGLMMSRWRWPALALLASLALSACEGESDNPEIAREQFLELQALPADVSVPFGAVPTTVPARSAVRFLNQASFGANDTELAAVQKDWRWGWMQSQFALPITETHWDQVKARQAIWVSQGTVDKPRDISKAPSEIFDYTIWESYFTAPDQLRKRVAYALSQVLVTSVDGFSGGGQFTALTGAAYMDVLERNAFGNFRQLLEEVTLSPAMGYYLSMRGNRKTEKDKAGNIVRVPDENYAREVMQLFTLGLYQLNSDGSVVNGSDGKPLEAYTQDDVAGLARVFTGWDLDTPVPDVEGERYRRPMKLFPARHETLEKKFLGETIVANTDGVTSLQKALDTLFKHPNVGPFISKQLIQRLVTSNPSSAYVQRVAAKFNDNGSGVRGDLKVVVDAILRDPEAMTPTNIAQPAPGWGKLREPVLRLTQMGRAFNIQAPAGTLWTIGNLSDPATELGQSPLRSPSVFNFYRPGYVPPNSALAGQGLVGPEFQITTDTSVPGYINAMQGFITKQPTGVTLDLSKELALALDPAALVARLDLMLANQALSQSTKDEITAAVTALPSTTANQQLTRVRTAMLMTLAAPEFIAQK
jgi:uncharacterized protein (DUF1800 family)